MSLDRLLGKWKSDPDDAEGYDKYGEVTVEFLDGGELVYTMNDPHRETTMLMQYRIEGDEIVTTQHSQPREERTKYNISADGKLSLTFGGVETHYVRDSEGESH